ncbi:MAG TPA: hypothetical protein VFE62_24710, partial [Gemmataceae bacterium]|nr:hypothetical protein [Gemmataceae bacterium]
DAGSLLTLSVQALTELWQEKQDPVLYDPVAVALVFTEKFCTMENLALDVDDKGFTRIVQDGKPNARVATAIQKDAFLDWIVDRLASAYPKALPTGRIVNESKMVPRGGFPHRVHACEDFETDIEKRWWLAGRTVALQTIMEANREKCKAAGIDLQKFAETVSVLEPLDKDFAKTGRTVIPVNSKFDEGSVRDLFIRNKLGKMVPLSELVSIRKSSVSSAGLSPDNTYALRGMLTQDFDDRQGETKTLYRAVVFNPVPGPPMGKRPHISFRYYLKGTDVLRVQLYSLTNGYHRCLMLKGLEQGKWLEGCVDMRDARKPDGTGGPLSENERIDDIQFYCDPRAELLVDDIVLYDAADAKETRPFPKRFLFTGWFDTGKQGKEWPGNFTIAPKEGYFWHAAKSVPDPDNQKNAWINIDLRGDRPIRDSLHFKFRYKLEGADAINLRIFGPKQSTEVVLRDLKKDGWHEKSVFLDRSAKIESVRSVSFVVPAGATLWIDDLLLYEK